MMEAQLVWDTWRRILRSDTLADAVLEPPGDLASLGLTPAETAILADYAGTRAATDQTIFMYRAGLVRNALCALRLVPLSSHLLEASGLDVEEVARDFTRAIDYRDEGPNLWRLAGELVAYLAERPELASGPARDVLSLDACTIALVRHVAEHPPAAWPDEAAARRARRTGRQWYVASPAACVVSTSHDLTPWLEHPSSFDLEAALDRVESHWLVYLPDAQSPHTYAEVSARAARAFTHLAVPSTRAQLAAELDLSPAAVQEVLDSLAALGAVTVASGPAAASAGAGRGGRRAGRLRFPDSAVIALDPAVEILAEEVDDHALLCHAALEVGMAVPPGEGLLDVVRALMGGPARAGDLRARYDDGELFDEILTSLVSRGFARVTPVQPAAAASLRRAIVIDLDAVHNVAQAWKAGGPTPEVLLRCARIADHASTIRKLASDRRSGSLRAHKVVIRTSDVRCNDATRESLLRLGAAVEIEGVEWPAPRQPIAGLAELVAALVPTHAVMAPGASLLDERARKRCADWVCRTFVCGLCLRLEGDASGAPALFEAVRELEGLVGDVVAVNVPDDEVLLGNTDRGWLAGEISDPDLRRAYVRWRIPILKHTEGRNQWGQVPEVEDRWVRAAEDLLPSSPALLGVGAGSRIVDLCGGMGRVARRLSPAVGADGLVISIERRRFIVERARRFALEGNFTNLQFRVGLAQRVPLPDGVMDAAVNEWTGAIWELGLGPEMVGEMARVVRPGGRAAVTHRLVQLDLGSLAEPWVQYPEIYRWVKDAFRHPKLATVAERVWGQVVPSQGGDNAADWREAHLPRLVNPNDYVFPADDPERGPGHVDVFLTMIAEGVRRHG